MPTYCTVPARYRRIRSNSLSSSGRFAGRPDSSDHTSGPEPTALPKPSQLPKSSKTECASESLYQCRAPARDTALQLAQQRCPTSVPVADLPASHSQRMGGRELGDGDIADT